MLPYCIAGHVICGYCYMDNATSILCGEMSKTRAFLLGHLVYSIRDSINHSCHMFVLVWMNHIYVGYIQ